MTPSDEGTVPVITAVLVDAGGSGGSASSPVAGVRVLDRAVGATSAARLGAALRPDLVIVDLDRTPAAPSVIDAVLTAAPEVRVLALAADPDPDVVLSAVRAGAVSVLRTDGTEPAELAAAAARTAHGEAVFSPGLAELVLARASQPVDRQQAARQLTEREADVLRLVVDGLTARQIAGRLGLSPRTVENHVQNVLRKLQLHSRAALVRFAIETGLA